MFGNFLRGISNNEWSQFTEYLSPVFFEIVPTLEIARQTTQLAAGFARLNHGDDEAPVRELIEGLGLPVHFRRDRDSSEMLSSLSRQEKGRILLELYFGQILINPLAWLDLRSATFEYLSKECIWNPGAWIIKWDPVFLNAMRKVYSGYYGSEETVYLEGLRELHLEHAADLFRKQFGNGEQTAVTFQMKDFRESFHEIFQSCKRQKTTIHPNFFALGLLLSSLYEHLEKLGGSFNVRSAYQEVASWKARASDG